MKTTPSRRRNAGFVSFLLVLSTGAVLTMLMIFAYRQALQSQEVQSQVQLRVDYSEKEDAILRSIVAITPNRAIRAMQSGSDLDGVRGPLSWGEIFTESLVMANARTSISPEMMTSLGLPSRGNTGDAALANPALIFKPVVPVENRFVSAGISNLGAGYPQPLSADATTSTLDSLYPIISYSKLAAGLSADGGPKFTLLKYPEINFGYTTPGADFVAKRNWWAFSVDAGAEDAALTRLARKKRNFVLSIYEIPSQLAISASSFMSLGQYSGGAAWQNVAIQGGVFAGKAEVHGNALSALTSRRNISGSSGASIGGQAVDTNPFAAGVREEYQVTQGAFFPVSLASESGRAAFIPINREEKFFDRFAHVEETNTLSTTTWNNYTIGALQCAMRLDVVEVSRSTDQDLDGNVIAIQMPKILHFSTKSGDSMRIDWPPVDHPPEYYPFAAFVRNGKTYISVYPERFPAFLSAEGMESVEINNSLVVNLDHTRLGDDFPTWDPEVSCGEQAFRVILTECDDLTPFSNGFSLVTNMRLYIGDNFNITPRIPGGASFPPCSLFAPEKRYGIDVDPNRVIIQGQIGSVAKVDKVVADDDAPKAISPLESINHRGVAVAADRITVNLSPITRVEDLPPITMMNWLVLLEEVR